MRGDPRLAPYRDRLLAIDGTLWPALPRMAWAIWRYQHGRECALKLHVKFNLLEEKPVGAVLKNARCCERSVAREQMQAGEFYVGDRYYGEDYALFGELEAAGCSFVLRLRQEAIFEVLEPSELSAEDRAAGVTFDGLVRLGARPKHAPVRLVRVQTEEGEILLVTDKPREELGAELIALIYRYRRGGGGDKRGLADGRAGASSSFSNGSSASLAAGTGWPRASAEWPCRFTAR